MIASNNALDDRLYQKYSRLNGGLDPIQPSGHGGNIAWLMPTNERQRLFASTLQELTADNAPPMIMLYQEIDNGFEAVARRVLSSWGIYRQGELMALVSPLITDAVQVRYQQLPRADHPNMQTLEFANGVGVINVHLKGGPVDYVNVRLQQIDGILAECEALRRRGVDRFVVMGDFNTRPTDNVGSGGGAIVQRIKQLDILGPLHDPNLPTASTTGAVYKTGKHFETIDYAFASRTLQPRPAPPGPDTKDWLTHCMAPDNAKQFYSDHALLLISVQWP